MFFNERVVLSYETTDFHIYSLIFTMLLHFLLFYLKHTDTLNLQLPLKLLHVAGSLAPNHVVTVLAAVSGHVNSG